MGTLAFMLSAGMLKACMRRLFDVAHQWDRLYPEAMNRSERNEAFPIPPPMIKLVYLKDLEKYMMAHASEGPLGSRLTNDILRRLDPYQNNGTTLWMWAVRMAEAEGGDMDVKEESYQTVEFIQRMDRPVWRIPSDQSVFEALFSSHQVVDHDR